MDKTTITTNYALLMERLLIDENMMAALADGITLTSIEEGSPAEHSTDYYVTRYYRCRECGHKDIDGVEVELFFEEDAPRGYVHGVWFCPECSEEYYDNIRLQARDGITRP